MSNVSKKTQRGIRLAAYGRRRIRYFAERSLRQITG